MRSVGHHPSARTISLALVAGFIAFEAFLALRTGALGIPGLFLVRFADESGAPNHAGHRQGPRRRRERHRQILRSDGGAETGAGARRPDLLPTAAGEPRLEGLAEIPLKPWDRATRRTPSGSGPRSRPARSQAGEELPWDAVEPVPFDAAAPRPVCRTTRPLRSAAAQAPLARPSGRQRGRGLGEGQSDRSQRRQDRARPLYHFEFWLEPPQDVKGSASRPSPMSSTRLR